MKYEHQHIEKKWRARWNEKPINQAGERKKKYYCLDMFPYPSGNGLHVGHWRGYVLSDAWSRYKVLQGYHVLHPMGWDAFGLPAENYAIQTGEHPAISTAKNVQNFKKQLSDISAVYDWEKEVNTTDPDYYRWTQWIFVKMFEQGLAYEKEMPINWCPSCKTGLANEEVKEGCCDRCGTEVTKKNLRQWMLKITAYAERLLADLEGLDWPDKVKKMQADWIGKSFGAEVDFGVEGGEERITVFTTRPDTLFGATFMVLAPEHPLAKELATAEQKEQVEKYIFDTSMRSSVDRMQSKEKTGVFTGSYAVNPLSGRKMPIWLSDYVLIDYGTGAIMCVPAHDERDFAFAKKFDLPIIPVIAKDGVEVELDEAYTEPGMMIHSEQFDGLDSEKAKEVISAYVEEKKIGKKTINYKLRDWVFSRQRYWGEPIPIVHCDKCGKVAVPEEELPVKLPEVESYEPTGTGESPLAAIADWVNTDCPKCGGPAKRETNTMPQWAGSSWYFLRYPDAKNENALADPAILKEWLPVDLYVGGIEHAVLHLLYARFYTKFLYDIKAVDFQEPFTRLFNQGMICRNGAKMSKSKGNVVSPDELVERYGSDSLRMYELFVGPPEVDAEWDDKGIDGVYRFLNKIWNLVTDHLGKSGEETRESLKLRHQLTYEITERLNTFRMNTIISSFMEFTNKLIDYAKKQALDAKTIDTILILLSPFAPHIAEELWEQMGHTASIFENTWPEYDKECMKEDNINIPIQVNGKMRGMVVVPADSDQATVLRLAKEEVASKLDGMTLVKEIYVPGKIVNLVVK